MLVFRTGHLGDTVCAIPAFRLVRSYFGNTELTLLCDQPRYEVEVPVAEIIQGLRLFDRIITYTSGQGLFTAWQLARAVRAVRPGLVVMLPQVRETVRSIHRKKRLFLCCGVPDTRGFQPRGPHHASHLNEANRLVQMLNSVGICGTKPAYDIPTDTASRKSVDEKLRAAGVNPARRLIVFCGGGKAATQCWPLDRYAAVLARLAAETDWEILGLGSSQEVENYRTRVLPRFAALRISPMPFTVPEIFELCRRAAVYFGNDTGPMHVSASVGCPVAVVMSARNAPGMWDPDVEPRLVVRRRTECEDCFLTECIVEQHRCMAEITVEQVAAEVIPFIKSLPGHTAERCLLVEGPYR